MNLTNSPNLLGFCNDFDENRRISDMTSARERDTNGLKKSVPRFCGRADIARFQQRRFVARKTKNKGEARGWTKLRDKPHEGPRLLTDEKKVEAPCECMNGHSRTLRMTRRKILYLSVIYISRNDAFIGDWRVATTPQLSIGFNLCVGNLFLRVLDRTIAERATYDIN